MDYRNLEHSAVGRTLLTGYGQAQGPVTLADIDLAELAREYIDEFMEWVLAGDPDALVSFAEEHPWLWRE